MNGEMHKGSWLEFPAIVPLVHCIAILTAGCSSNLGVFGSPYTVDYRMVEASVEVTIRGPAARLAVILTDPQRRSKQSIIEKDQMISNSQTVQLLLEDPIPGEYKLLVKTVDPEKVVWQKDFTLALQELKVEDITFHLEPARNLLGQSIAGGYFLSSIDVAVQKVGNLPVVFSVGPVAVGDIITSESGTNNADYQKGYCLITGGGVMLSEKQTVSIQLVLPCTAKNLEEQRRRGWHGLPGNQLFWPGDRYTVKGKLTYDKGKKSLEFVKELAVSGGR